MWRRKLPYYFRKIEQTDIEFSGNPKDAEFVIWLCTRYLKKKPNNVHVILSRAKCYEALAKYRECWADIELAYALDDTFIPAIYAYATMLLDQNDIENALPLLSLIKDHPLAGDGVNAALSEICMRQAKANVGCEYQLRAWLCNFDEIRYANAFLFRLTYSNFSEMTCSQEHQFWAKTLIPVVDTKPTDKEAIKPVNHGTLKTAGKKRKKIGYWGSDFREHSVRYFSRPLIENHDHNNWEVYVYDDNFKKPAPDQHTEAFIAASENYFDTTSYHDDQVVGLILSHELDILVDITGHTSANRMHCWQHRLARVMMTGLAYPPTTGLSSIDYKLVDIHMVSEKSHQYYTEKQLILPESFWCFDPKEDAYYNDQPPYKKSKNVIFACMGNAAKISDEMMQAWAKILKGASNVQLMVVSQSFGDATIVKNFTENMEYAGVDLSRLTCRPAYGRDELWQRYSEVDLILDTFPFNGGTTSCWATYAGVPVLTMAGKSLSSCMGKSIMTNLRFPEFVVNSFEEYVEKAINVAKKPEIIARFRSCARKNFVESSLGNGKKFAKEFELICEQVLDHAANVPAPNVPPLPLQEMLRRARMIWYVGNIPACERILNLCRAFYGKADEISEFYAETLLGQKRFNELSEIIATMAGSNKLRHIGALCDIAQSNDTAAIEKIRVLCAECPDVSDKIQYLQTRLWRAWLKVYDSGKIPQKEIEIKLKHATRKYAFFLIHDDDVEFEKHKNQIEALFQDGLRYIAFEKVSKMERADSLNLLLKKYGSSDVMVLLLRDGVEPVDPGMLSELEAMLQRFDVVGPAGGLRWEQKDWTLDLPEYKAWGLMRPSLLNEALFELHFAGIDANAVVEGAVVLDGKFLAFYPSRLSALLFDDDMGDAGLWIEEDWCHRVFMAGHTLAVHRALGLVMHPTLEIQSIHTAAGQKNLLTRIAFDPLRLPNVNHDVCTVQVKSKDIGVLVGKIMTAHA